MLTLIPWEEVPVENLNALLSEFVSRDGTDYGDYDITNQEKIAQLMQALKQGSAHLIWDDVSESASVIDRDQARAHQLL